ncbi:MAG: hypothetical protein R2828_25800 [Saprospiraceae bacterium]
MNNRKLKLALTVGLINAGNSNLLGAIKELVSGFKEAGNFLGEKLIRKNWLNPDTENQRYAIRFEHCTVDVDLIANLQNCNQYVRGFQIR